MLGWKSKDHMDFDFHDAHDLNTITDRANEETVKRKLRALLANANRIVYLSYILTFFFFFTLTLFIPSFLYSSLFLLPSFLFLSPSIFLSFISPHSSLLPTLPLPSLFSTSFSSTSLLTSPFTHPLLPISSHSAISLTSHLLLFFSSTFFFFFLTPSFSSLYTLPTSYTFFFLLSLHSIPLFFSSLLYPSTLHKQCSSLLPHSIIQNRSDLCSTSLTMPESVKPCAHCSLL